MYLDNHLLFIHNFSQTRNKNRFDNKKRNSSVLKIKNKMLLGNVFVKCVQYGFVYSKISNNTNFKCIPLVKADLELVQIPLEPAENWCQF